jgi:hypothetical protein
MWYIKLNITTMLDDTSDFSPNQPTNQPTPWRRALLEKLTVTQLVKKFSTSDGTQSFIPCS